MKLTANSTLISSPCRGPSAGAHPNLAVGDPLRSTAGRARSCTRQHESTRWLADS